MPILQRLLIAIAVWCFAVPSPAQAAAVDDASAVLQEWVGAFNAGDVDKMVALYTPDASVLGATSTDLAVGPDALRAYFAAGARNKTQVKLGSNLPTVVNDGVVVLTGFYEFSGTGTDGRTFTAPARYTFVVVKQDGAWHIASQHSSLRPKPLP